MVTVSEALQIANTSRRRGHLTGQQQHASESTRASYRPPHPLPHPTPDRLQTLTANSFANPALPAAAPQPNPFGALGGLRKPLVLDVLGCGVIGRETDGIDARCDLQRMAITNSTTFTMKSNRKCAQNKVTRPAALHDGSLSGGSESI